MPSSSHSLAGALGHDLSDRRIGILRQIGALGSISRAARAVGVSYKAAWQAVDTLTNLAGVALVERVVGGRWWWWGAPDPCRAGAAGGR